MWKQPEVHPEQQWVSEGSLDSSDVIVQLGGYKMLEREMQLLDYAQPARAGKSKKKYGTFLADFKKQLWVGNSEQSSRALQLQDWIHQPSWKSPTAIKYVSIWESPAKSPSFLLERECQGLCC